MDARRRMRTHSDGRRESIQSRRDRKACDRAASKVRRVGIRLPTYEGESVIEVELGSVEVCGRGTRVGRDVEASKGYRCRER
jgi:hypothetical protein